MKILLKIKSEVENRINDLSTYNMNGFLEEELQYLNSFLEIINLEEIKKEIIRRRCDINVYKKNSLIKEEIDFLTALISTIEGKESFEFNDDIDCDEPTGFEFYIIK